MEDLSPYTQDPWDDDWGWEEPEEPQITYRDSVEQIRKLVQGRADVRVEWGGRRHLPRDDARIVFTSVTGTGETRVRFRSAVQLGDITRIINSATLLADRHAVWYPNDHVIRAGLVGDYEQFHAVVARRMAPKLKSRRFVPDSPLGRSVADMLASSGAFLVQETGPPEPDSRAIRTVSTTQDLRLLYGPHGQEVPSLAIELSNFVVADAVRAEEALVEYGTAYLFKLGKATGVSLHLWRSEDRLADQRRQAYSSRVQFPKRRYDAHPAELYAAANSTARDPVERYLKCYQILEFYMTKAADSVASSQGVPVQTATSPLRPPPNNRLGIEQNRLDAVISLAVTPTRLANLLNDKELFAAVSNPHVIVDVQTLSVDASGLLVAGCDYRLETSTRVYGIRNRIVHMKEGGGRSGQQLLAPYSREARDLTSDLRLVRFLAEYAMERWATSLP